MNQQRWGSVTHDSKREDNEALLASSLQTPSFKFQRYSQMG